MTELSDLVRDNSELYNKTKKEVYAENKHLLRFATYVDKWAKTLSIPSAAIDSVTIRGLLGVLPSMTMDLLKKAPKLGFLAYCGAKSHDVVGTIGSLLYESASLVPFAGEFLDFHERYSKQTTNYLHNEVKKRFITKIAERSEEKQVLQAAA